MGQEALELNLATTLLVEAAIAPTHHIHDLVMAHLRAPARTSIIIAVRLVGEEASLVVTTIPRTSTAVGADHGQ